MLRAVRSLLLAGRVSSSLAMILAAMMTCASVGMETGFEIHLGLWFGGGLRLHEGGCGALVRRWCI